MFLPDYKTIVNPRHIVIKVFTFGFLENSFCWHRADIFGKREREREERERVREKGREGGREGERQKDSKAKLKGDFLEYARALLPYK
jgi:hypothetical protein